MDDEAEAVEVVVVGSISVNVVELGAAATDEAGVTEEGAAATGEETGATEDEAGATEEGVTELTVDQ